MQIIPLLSNSITAKKIHEEISTLEGLRVNLKEQSEDVMALDPFVVEIVIDTVKALIPVITTLLTIRSNKKKEIHSKSNDFIEIGLDNGVEIRIPSHTSKDKIEEMIHSVKKISDIRYIELIGSEKNAESED